MNYIGMSDKVVDDVSLPIRTDTGISVQYKTNFLSHLPQKKIYQPKIYFLSAMTQKQAVMTPKS